MQARKLRALLNNTGYIVSQREDYICVGSPMSHKLISIDKKTLALKYSLDTFNKGGRACLQGKDESSVELLFIWDTLEAMIADGSIKEIIELDDVIENPLPVFTYDYEGNIIETFTDKYGWPNCDISGNTMHDNTHFPTKQRAIEKAILEYELGNKYDLEQVTELEQRLGVLRKRIEQKTINLFSFNEMLEGFK